MVIVRFLLRFLMIPLGIAAAAIAVTVVLAAMSWSGLVARLGVDSDPDGDAVVMLFTGAAVFFALGTAALAMTLPALLAVALAEIVAIRSWLYYCAAGGLAAWLGWWSMDGARKDNPLFNEPTLIAAAGIAGGLAYWLVAGWNAGFWRPVFAPGAAQLSVPQPPRPPA
jgi:hypothetical protein